MLLVEVACEQSEQLYLGTEGPMIAVLAATGVALEIEGQEMIVPAGAEPGVLWQVTDGFPVHLLTSNKGQCDSSSSTGKKALGKKASLFVPLCVCTLSALAGGTRCLLCGTKNRPG